MPCAEQSFTKIAKTQFITYARMISKLYTIISNKLWDLSLYFRNRYNRWVLSSQQTALRSYKCARFRAKQTYRNYNFRYLLTFVSVEESFSRKKLFFFLIYTIISNKLWDSSLYFGHRYNRWVLASQQTALGPCKFARFRAKQTYKNSSFRYLLTFVSVKESFSRKKAFS